MNVVIKNLDKSFQAVHAFYTQLVVTGRVNIERYPAMEIIQAPYVDREAGGAVFVPGQLISFSGVKSIRELRDFCDKLISEATGEAQMIRDYDASPENDARIESLIDGSGGVWHEDLFHIGSKELYDLINKASKK